MNARALVMAKAPVPGQVKTRLGAKIGMEAAADLAAAALLDTLDTCHQTFGAECHLALDGDLGFAVRGEEIKAALKSWHVFDQCSGEFGARLAHAHTTVARTSADVVVQIGMDTPQVTSTDLGDVVGLATDGAAVLGPAPDGGWWVLALGRAERARVLAGVPMSVPQTHEETRRALGEAGIEVRSAATRRDVDTIDDAVAVALASPLTRFGQAWRELAGAAR